MKEERKVIGLDPYEEGAVLLALNDMRNKQLKGKESTDFLDALLLKVLRAPNKKVKVRRDETR